MPRKTLIVESGAYQAARARCIHPTHYAWKNYGGRGIEFRFTSFPQFLAHIGLRPSPRHTLDRIDNKGHYEIGNVRWATWEEQAANRRPRARKGYYYHTPTKQWKAQFRIKGKSVFLGSFGTEAEAKAAYEKHIASKA